MNTIVQGMDALPSRGGAGNRRGIRNGSASLLWMGYTDWRRCMWSTFTWARRRPLMETMPWPWRLLNHATNHGHQAVVVFIVLSGFVLMLPVVSPTRPFDIRDYFRRRAERILPAYFAALLIFLLAGLVWRSLILLIERSSGVSRFPTPFVQEPTTVGLLSHFLLVQNLKYSWSVMVDPPMWSIATEWQIYFFFPFVLLPVWRRFGARATIVVALFLGMLPVVLVGRTTDLTNCCPWFLTLFAMGMSAAELSVSSEIPRILQEPRFFAVAGLILGLGILVVDIRMPRIWGYPESWHKDLICGVFVALLLVYLARSQLRHPSRPPLLALLLQTRLCLGFGALSYSLYLVHFPIVSLFSLTLRYHPKGAAYITAMMVLVPLASIGYAYVFHRAFERHEFVAPGKHDQRMGRAAAGTARFQCEARQVLAARG